MPLPRLDGGRQGVHDRAELVEERGVDAVASRSCAFGTATVSSSVRAPSAPSTLRVSAAAQTPPNMPVLDESTATGLFRTGDSASGRDTQSSAFLSTPGIDERTPASRSESRRRPREPP